MFPPEKQAAPEADNTPTTNANTIKFLYKPDRLANYPLHSIMTTFYHKYSNLKIADIKNKYFYNILQLKGLYLNIFII